MHKNNGNETMLCEIKEVIQKIKCVVFPREQKAIGEVAILLRDFKSYDYCLLKCLLL